MSYSGFVPKAKRTDLGSLLGTLRGGEGVGVVLGMAFFIAARCGDFRVGAAVGAAVARGASVGVEVGTLRRGAVTGVSLGFEVGLTFSRGLVSRGGPAVGVSLGFGHVSNRAPSGSLMGSGLGILRIGASFGPSFSDIGVAMGRLLGAISGTSIGRSLGSDSVRKLKRFVSSVRAAFSLSQSA